MGLFFLPVAKTPPIFEIKYFVCVCVVRLLQALRWYLLQPYRWNYTLNFYDIFNTLLRILLGFFGKSLFKCSDHVTTDIRISDSAVIITVVWYFFSVIKQLKQSLHRVSGNWGKMNKLIIILSYLPSHSKWHLMKDSNNKVDTPLFCYMFKPDKSYCFDLYIN